MGKGAGQCDREPLGLAVASQAKASDTRKSEKRRPGPRRYWTEERIEAELREFLRGRTYWPTIQQFKDAGLGGLQDRIKKDGSVDRWIRHFGMAFAWQRMPNGRSPFLRDTAKRLLQSPTEHHGQFVALPTDPIPVSGLEMRMLLAIHIHPEVKSTVVGLAARSGTSKNDAATLLGTLSEKGLIEERRHPAGAMHWIRTLTEQGEVLVKRFLLAQLKADMADPDDGSQHQPADQHFPLGSHSDVT